jgi:glyoxylase-like metal-dependent hydrolase (beta-lactamase superfamily II)
LTARAGRDYEKRRDGAICEILPDLAYQRALVVNVAYVGRSGARDWVLIDAGLPASGRAILDSIAERFGGPPVAIVLTHAHFDHVGMLRALAQSWNVPIYAHPAEFPFLNGTRSYPAPDARASGSLLSALQPFYPRGPVDVSRWLHALGDDGRVPPLPEWQWLPTPGHTAGHVSLWRARDRTLLAGDALITTTQARAYDVTDHEPELDDPPKYYTEDQMLAKMSVQRLAALEPETIVPGHGRVFRGSLMRAQLHALAGGFDRLAAPAPNRETMPALSRVQR